MSHKLGIYYAPAHDRSGDWDYIRRLNSPVVRILMPGATSTELVSRVHQAAPNARIALRWWDVDDGGEGNKRAKLDNPDASAANDAREYMRRIEQMEQQAQAAGMPFPARSRLWVNALNEPPTWEHDKRPAIVDYNRRLISDLRPHGVPTLALCLAVGHPEEWPPVWEWARPVMAAILASPGSALELHSYWQLEGPDYIWTDAQGNQRKDWGALAGRYIYCPYDVPIVIGEIGADGRLYGRKPAHTGWRGNMSAQQYADQLGFYLTQIHQDKRILAALPFLTDYQDGASWASFDTADAHDEILAMVQTLPPVSVSPSPGPGPTPPPVVTPPPAQQPIARGKVSAPSGLNVRSGPGIDSAKVDALPSGAVVTIYEIKRIATVDWLRIGPQRWINSIWVEVADDVPPQPPPPVGDKWARTMAFVEKWEGGYQNIHNDKGNWTGCEVGVGVNKGTKYGISACSYPDLDIANLRREESREIFRRDYWVKSGADMLDWPLCLLVMDTAVLHGVSAATSWLAEVGPNPYLFAARRLRSYVKADNFDFWGKAWTLRVAELLEAVGA